MCLEKKTKQKEKRYLKLRQRSLQRGAGCAQHQALPEDPSALCYLLVRDRLSRLLCSSPAPDTWLRPLSPHTRPLPRLKDHLFFQRFENDGQEWLSSESDIWEPSEPCARYNPKQETTARSTAELSAV